jgi:hypothetical protein
VIQVDVATKKATVYNELSVGAGGLTVAADLTLKGDATVGGSATLAFVQRGGGEEWDVRGR